METEEAPPACTDPFYRRAARVSMGTVFQIPWTRLSGDETAWPGEGLALLREYHFKTAAMALTDNSVNINDRALMAEKKIAVILGTEGDGLLPETIEASDYTVCIPMMHGAAAFSPASWSAQTAKVPLAQVQKHTAVKTAEWSDYEIQRIRKHGTDRFGDVPRHLGHRRIRLGF